MQLSVVIPAFNEEKRLEDTLIKSVKYLKSHFDKFEIIVVDDGSTDSTVEIASRYSKENVRVIRNGTNKGKGFSVKNGILNSNYEYILFMDSDLATPMEELMKFINILEQGYDVAVASRNFKESIITVKQPKYRKVIGFIFSRIVIFLLGLTITDTQCGFKIFRSNAAKVIFNKQTINGYAFDTEILFIAKKIGFRLIDLPVTWTDKKGGKVKVIKDSIQMLRDVFLIRYNNLIGLYNR